MSGAVAGQLADDLQAQLVGPVEVIEHQHRRSIDRLEDPVRGRADDEPPRPERVAAVTAIDGEQVLGKGAQGGVAAHPGRHLANRGERHLLVLRRNRTAVDPQARRFGLAHHRADEARLAQPRLAGQEERPPPAATTSAVMLIRELEEIIPADEDGALDGADAAHRRSLDPVSSGHRSNDRWSAPIFSD